MKSAMRVRVAAADATPPVLTGLEAAHPLSSALDVRVACTDIAPVGSESGGISGRSPCRGEVRAQRQFLVSVAALAALFVLAAPAALSAPAAVAGNRQFVEARNQVVHIRHGFVGGSRRERRHILALGFLRVLGPALALPVAPGLLRILGPALALPVARPPPWRA